MTLLLHPRFNPPIRLFIEKLPKHPEYAKAPAVDKSKTKKLLKQALPRAMELKQQLKARYDKERDEMERVIREEVMKGRGLGKWSSS